MTGQREHLARDPGPARRLPAGAEVVHPGLGTGGEQVLDRGGEVVREGQAADLVVDHARVDAALGEARHGRDEVLSLPHDPAGAQHEVLRQGRHQPVAGGLGLPVDAERGQRLRLVMDLRGAVEDVVARDVDEGGALGAGGLDEPGDAVDVHGPGLGPALGGLGGVDGGVRGGVDDRAVGAEVEGSDGLRGGEVQAVAADEVHVGPPLPARGERAPQLTVRADDQGAARRDRGDVRQARVVQVLRGELGLRERDRPGDRDGLVGEVQEGVLRLRGGGPVVVDEVGVGRGRLEGLEGVAHPAGHEDRDLRGDLLPVDGAEGVSLAQVHPGAEHPPGRDGDVLVPGLGVDAAGDARGLVEGDVVLDGAEVRQSGGEHLLALPVLLEPASCIPVDGQVHDEQSGDRGLVDDGQRGHWPTCAYFASVAAFCGRHQASFRRYQSTVAARPAAKSG